MLLIIIVYHVKLAWKWVTESLRFRCQAGLKIKTCTRRGQSFADCRDAVGFLSPFVLAVMERWLGISFVFAGSLLCSTGSTRLLPIVISSTPVPLLHRLGNHETYTISVLFYSLVFVLQSQLSHLENPNKIFSSPNIKDRGEKLYIYFTKFKKD